MLPFSELKLRHVPQTAFQFIQVAQPPMLIDLNERTILASDSLDFRFRWTPDFFPFWALEAKFIYRKFEA